MHQRIARKIYETLRTAQEVVIVVHKNPDGDALGSATACHHLLENMGVKSKIYYTGTISPHLHYLPYLHRASNDETFWYDVNPDVVLVLDSSNLSRTGTQEIIPGLLNNPVIINVDHHRFNDHFGDLNLVIESASSTAEVLYRIFSLNEVEIDPTIATSLLTGIITDTGNFTNSATTKLSLKIASELIKQGGSLRRIQDWNFNNRSVSSLKLWGVIMSRLKKHPTLNIIYTYMTKEDAAEFKQRDDNGFANFLNCINEGLCGLFVTEINDHVVKGSFRTTRDDVDVAKISQLFNGGGHKKAAGFSLDSSLDEAFDTIFSTLEKNIDDIQPTKLNKIERS